MAADVPIITLATDFGQGSPYVAQIKGAILSLNRAASIVDITHAIPPQDIAAGSVVLAETCSAFPEDTIHIAVVDPGVGSDRAILYLRNRLGAWIAPDNGLLTQVCQLASPLEIRRISERKYWRLNVSSTFHGRDVMAPVAAHLTLGVATEQLGELLADCTLLPLPALDVRDGEIRGEIVTIDSFGNAVTNITRQAIPSSILRQLKVVHGDRWISGLVNTYADSQPGTLVALLGSGDAVELAVVNGSAAELLGAKVGEEVVVRWSADEGEHD